MLISIDSSLIRRLSVPSRLDRQSRLCAREAVDQASFRSRGAIGSVPSSTASLLNRSTVRVDCADDRHAQARTPRIPTSRFIERDFARSSTGHVLRLGDDCPLRLAPRGRTAGRRLARARSSFVGLSLRASPRAPWQRPTRPMSWTPASPTEQRWRARHRPRKRLRPIIATSSARAARHPQISAVLSFATCPFRRIRTCTSRQCRQRHPSTRPSDRPASAAHGRPDTSTRLRDWSIPIIAGQFAHADARRPA